MKLIRRILLAVGIIILSCVFITSCSLSSNKDDNSDITGTYYLYEDNLLDKSTYFKLSSDSWTDENNDSGTYKLSESTIIFYMSELGNEELYRGTIGSGKLEISFEGIKTTYYKEGSEPTGDDSKPDDSSSITKVNVTFDANGGSFTSGTSITVKKDKNSLISAPTSPTKNGEIFSGWTTEKNGNIFWNFSEDKVVSDITLYAKWIQNDASIISFDGASFDGNNIYLLVEHTTEYLSLANMIVTSSNSTWKLYYDRLGQMEIPTKIAASTSGKLLNGDNIFYIVVNSGNQTNLYELNVYRSFEVNVYYKDDISVINVETAYAGYDYNINYTPSIEGYTFNYWTLDGSRIDKINPKGDINLIANKTANNYKVRLDTNGGNELSISEYSITFDSSYQLTIPTRTGYTFIGWEYNNSLLTNSIGESINVYKYASDITLKAKWQINKYNVFTSTNNSSAGLITQSNQYDYDTVVELVATANPGYSFDGWYQNEILVSNLSTFVFNMPAEDLSYEARWSINNTPYKVEHYKQNIINDEYSLFETDNLSGVTNTLTNGNVKQYEGFISPNITQQNINGDGSTVIKLYYQRKYYSITLDISDENGGLLDGNGEIEKVPYVQTNDSKYKWITDETSISSTNKTHLSTSSYKFTFNFDGIFKFDESASTESGFDFLKVYKNGIELSDFKISGTISKTNQTINVLAGDYLEFKYVKDNSNSSNDDAVYITNINFIYNKNIYKYGEEVSITATANDGYTFIGWFIDDVEVFKETTYVFNMPAEDLIIEAKLNANTNTCYKVEHYQQSINGLEYELVETDNLVGTTNTLTNATAKIYEGFTSPAVVQQIINGDGTTIIKLNYARNTYEVILEKNIADAGSVTGNGTYFYGESITLSASTNDGYTFDGWYIGDEQITTNLNYSFVMPANNVNYSSAWEINQYMISLINSDSIAITGINSGSYYDFNTEIALSADVSLGYIVEWSRSDSIIYYGNDYKFTVPSLDITISAKLIKIFTKEDNYIYFGTYPQTKVTDETLIETLSGMVTNLPTSTDSYDWLDGAGRKYKDFDINDDGKYDYRATYLNNALEWFKYEQIKWVILKEENGKAFILSDLILDCQMYNDAPTSDKYEHNGGIGYANNYELSNIRKWINEEMINEMFVNAEQSIINITEVKNDKSTGDYQMTDDFACNNTFDKLFLLSYREAWTYKDYMATNATDYSYAQGTWVENNVGMWYYRSPYAEKGIQVDYGFDTSGWNYTYVHWTTGVRVACWITL